MAEDDKTREKLTGRVGESKERSRRGKEVPSVSLLMTFWILRRRRGPSIVVGIHSLLLMEGVGEHFKASKNKVAAIIAVAIPSHNENT